ncbi:MAG TPA: hypothetical protein VN113_02525 [Caulobacter sp.]|nr:hypothetical protein [Caulobacter sp.]
MRFQLGDASFHASRVAAAVTAFQARCGDVKRDGLGGDLVINVVGLNGRFGARRHGYLKL